jgi:hypothetical protein
VEKTEMEGHVIFKITILSWKSDDVALRDLIIWRYISVLQVSHEETVYGHLFVQGNLVIRVLVVRVTSF